MPSVTFASGRTREVLKSDLSPARQRLIELLGCVHFGRICDLAVLGGEPVFQPNTTVIRTLKIAGQNFARPAAASSDFVLKNAYWELLDHLSRIGDGVIERIEVAHGLPLLLEIREPTAIA